MVYLRTIYFKTILVSLTFAKTPIEYGFSLSSGYDDNVMRLSFTEVSETSNNSSILGGAKKLDSFTSKLGLFSKKSLWQLGKKELVVKGNIHWADYYHNQFKKYWSGGLDIIYRWGSYKNIKYTVRHLDDFYLRHYINRDVSNSEASPCLFSDQNQKITITYLVHKPYWANFSIGYLQRYYKIPFTEFDLDILYFKSKISRKINKIGSISLQIENGVAKSESHQRQFRPSSFNRSYETVEWFLPLTIRQKNKFFNEFGISIRQEKRKYVAEEFNDPLHSGRDHLDTKYDFWFKKKINEMISTTVSNRFRTRKTNSKYDWVSDLKSFDQFQVWIKIEWEFVYDQY